MLNVDNRYTKANKNVKNIRFFIFIKLLTRLTLWTLRFEYKHLPYRRISNNKHRKIFEALVDSNINFVLPFVIPTSAFSVTRMVEYPSALYFKKNGDQGISLEIGCGTSPFSSFISTNYNERLVSLDIDMRAVYENRKTTKELEANVDFINCDAQTLPFRNNIFKYIYSISVLEHIPNDTKASIETIRVLNKNGIATIIIPFSHKPKDPIYVNGMWQRYYTLKDINNLFGKVNITLLLYMHPRIMHNVFSKIIKGWFWIKDIFITTICLLLDSNKWNLWNSKFELASVLLIIRKDLIEE